METEKTADTVLPLLTLRFLGGFSAHLRGGSCDNADAAAAGATAAIVPTPVPVMRGRTTTYLLTLLALHAPRPLSREFLRETLWPDSRPEASSQNLRRALADLRTVLGEAAAACVVSPTARTLLLDRKNVQCDLFDFTGAVQSDDDARAVACYNGSLLPECGEVWILAERESLRQSYLCALENLANAQSDVLRRVPLLRRLLAEEPLRETAACALMTDLAGLGDNAGAAKVFRDLRAGLLEARLGGPQPETEARYRDLLQRSKKRGPELLTLLPPGLTKTSPLNRDGTTAAAAAARIPAPLNRLIGRDEAVYDIARRLSLSRLVTLTGTGGVGKTRLAQEVAREVAPNFAGSVWFVDLAPVTKGENCVARTVASLLGVETEEINRDALSLEAALEDFLAPRSLLLLLDNCEHLIEPVAVFVHKLLTTCPDIRILATSRQPLNLTGETLWRVPSLPTADAVILFNERAMQAYPDFAPAPEVEEMCRRLDGIPLALELAAARLRHLPLSEITSRLVDRFALLTNGNSAALPRQRTLRALIEWSWDLLTDEERLLLTRLSVFVGGWTVEAADAVYGGPSLTPLAGLVDKSLVAHRGEGRYYLLETIRQFAAEQLKEQGQASVTDGYRRHRDYFLSVAENNASRLYGTEHDHLMKLLIADNDNLRAALRCFQEDNASPQSEVSCEPDAVGFVQMTGALWRFWYGRSQYAEAHTWLSASLSCFASLNDAVPPSPLLPVHRVYQGRACYGLGHVELELGNISAAEDRFTEARAAFLAGNSARGAAYACHGAGRVAHMRGDLQESYALYQEALRITEAEQETSDPHNRALFLSCIALAAKDLKETACAETHARTALAVYRQIGHASGISRALGLLGSILMEQGNLLEATLLLNEALAAADAAEDGQYRGWALRYLGDVAMLQGQEEEAHRLLTICLTEAQERREEILVQSAQKALSKLARA